MKNKRVFTKSLTFLVVGVLLVTAFIRSPAQVWWYAAVFAVWGLWTLGSLLYARRLPLRSLRKASLRLKKPQDESNQVQIVYTADDDSATSTALMLHVNCRISAYLKSAYPEVTWEWSSREPEKLAADGGVGRIRLYGVSDFNYADVMLDRMGRIDSDMLRIVPLSGIKGSGEPKEPPARNDLPVDPAVWFNIQGKKILETCVADLNSRGHASLLIKENGDICIDHNNSEKVCDKLSNLPGKSLWKQLAKVIENKGFSASATDAGITVSW